VSTFVLLLKKDLRESLAVVSPAFLMGFSVFILLQLSRDIPHAQTSDFWFSFFVSSSALFYRSFSLEHRSQNFAVYRAAGLSLQKLFWSQVIVQMLRLLSIGFLLVIVLAAFGLPAASLWPLCLSVGFAMSPFATFLGLSLKAEKEFLFSFVYFPFVTPLVLAGASLSSADSNQSVWWSILILFGLGASFISAVAFEFFFDDLA